MRGTESSGVNQRPRRKRDKGPRLSRRQVGATSRLLPETLMVPLKLPPSVLRPPSPKEEP